MMLEISVTIPKRNQATTLGPVVRSLLARSRLRGVGLL